MKLKQLFFSFFHSNRCFSLLHCVITAKLRKNNKIKFEEAIYFTDLSFLKCPLKDGLFHRSVQSVSDSAQSLCPA